ncbi:MAG: hypothetical protein NVSMB14_07370 [Isosphaeraceae bacterium]
MEASRARTRLRGLRSLILLFLGLVPTICEAAGSYRTKNFAVEAPSADIARQVAERAERYRAQIARQWLGRELADWKTPCPIRVKITGGEAGGLTTFTFARGKVLDQIMSVEGRLDRILASSLPHEITHTITAGALGREVPRWADEGVSVLSEDRRERDRHDQIAAHLLARNKEMPLERLFRVEQYPRDLMGFYGQGYSVSRFLVEFGGRPRLLAYLRDGETLGWDAATRVHYGIADVAELDRAWRSWHQVLASRDSADGRMIVQTGSSSRE